MVWVIVNMALVYQEKAVADTVPETKAAAFAEAISYINKALEANPADIVNLYSCRYFLQNQ